MTVTVDRPIAERPARGGLVTWLTTTDHKKIGILYVTSAFGFFLIAGVFALLMRTELAQPGIQFLDRQGYSELFTIHGTTMLFLFAAPFGLGLGNYLVPLQIGAPDMAFPRLNALSYWLFLAGALVIFSGFGASGGAANVGWTGYPPLSELRWSPSIGVDLWVVGLSLTGIATIMTAINLVTTIVLYRAPGMTMWRMPVFTWEILITALLLLMAFPSLTAAFSLLLIDRLAGGHAFDPGGGGDPILYQHLFWFLGHPEVYIIILPVFGIISEIIPVFSRKPIFGYAVMVMASVAIGFISLGVWAHHMFTVGMEPAGNTFFVLSTMLIAVPTGIKLFNWLATMWGGKIQFRAPMLFCTAFLFQFLIAGLTGIMLGSAPFDWHLGNSYFVVAHFHYVIVGAILFTVFAAFYYWFPKFSGRLYSETLGRLHFWLFFFGFHLTFDCMHIPGLLGMPRRIYTYEPGRGWDTWNLLVTIGVVFQGLGTLVFLANLVWSYWKGARAGNDPWDAWTLEWSTESPPPAYNFATLPVVRSRRPLWDLKHPEDPDWKYEQ